MLRQRDGKQRTAKRSEPYIALAIGYTYRPQEMLF